MRMTWLAVIVAVVCLGAWTVSAQTQQDQQAQKAQQAEQQAQQARQQAQQALQQEQQGGMGGSQGGMGQQRLRHPAPALLSSPNDMQIQGKVLGKSTDVNVQGDKDHRVVRVQTREGQTMMVDLGVKSKIPEGFEVREGQWVIVTGRQGRLGNDNVLVAHNVANVYNFMPGAAAEGGAKLEGDSQSLEEKTGDDGSGTGGTRAQYRDYPGHVGGSGDGAAQPQHDSDQNKE